MKSSTLYLHPTIASCTVYVYDGGAETWIADHGVVDERGRKVGGRVAITPSLGSTYLIRIIGLRDGVRFGASRRATHCATPKEARALAADKLMRQRSQFQRKHRAPAARPTFATSKLTDAEIESGWSMCVDASCRPLGLAAGCPHAHKVTP